MNYKLQDYNLSEVSNQLERSYSNKEKLIKNICKEYEAYLIILRKNLLISFEKGIRGIYSQLSEDRVINFDRIINLLNEDIRLEVNSQIPFLTLEQLKIYNIDYQNQFINKESSTFQSELKEYQKNHIFHNRESMYEESLQFNCSENSNGYEYYEFLHNEKILSINLDHNFAINPLTESTDIEDYYQEEKSFLSFFELIGETNQNKFDDLEDKDCEIDFFISNQSLNCFNLIDRSLDNLLLNLSYRINLKLFEKDVITKFISEESFKCLAVKNYLVKHKLPYNISLDLNNKTSKSNLNFLNIYLVNIDATGLEIDNLELSICRNKINELKHNFKMLHKKEVYWKKKEIFFKNICK